MIIEEQHNTKAHASSSEEKAAYLQCLCNTNSKKVKHVIHQQMAMWAHMCQIRRI